MMSHPGVHTKKNKSLRALFLMILCAHVQGSSWQEWVPALDSKTIAYGVIGLSLLYVGVQLFKGFKKKSSSRRTRYRSGTSHRNPRYAVGPQYASDNNSSQVMNMLALGTLTAVIGAVVQRLFSEHSDQDQATKSGFECSVNVSPRDLIAPSNEFKRLANRVVRADKDLPPMLILYGPTGSGKSFRARVLAAARGGRCFELKALHTESKYAGVGIQAIGRLFEHVVTTAQETDENITVLIDEVEGHLPPREHLNDGSVGHDKRGKVNAFAVGIDKINDNKLNGRILIIGTTNHRNQMDAIFNSRPGRCELIEIANPKRIDQRKEILIHYFKKYCAERQIKGPSKTAIGQLAEYTQGKSTDDLRAHALESVKRASEGSYTFVPDDIVYDVIKSLQKRHIDNKSKESGIPRCVNAPDWMHDTVTEQGGMHNVLIKCNTLATTLSHIGNFVSSCYGMCFGKTEPEGRQEKKV